jgi:hypothetical protein
MDPSAPMPPTKSVLKRFPDPADKFPVPQNKFPVRLKKFPVTLRRKIGQKMALYQYVTSLTRAFLWRNLQKFPVFSLYNREIM